MVTAAAVGSFFNRRFRQEGGRPLDVGLDGAEWRTRPGDATGRRAAQSPERSLAIPQRSRIRPFNCSQTVTSLDRCQERTPERFVRRAIAAIHRELRRAGCSPLFPIETGWGRILGDNLNRRHWRQSCFQQNDQPGPKALDQMKQCKPRPEKGMPALRCSSGPLGRGCWSSAWFGIPFFVCAHDYRTAQT